MAKRKTGRDVHGIVLLDKRLGVSSNQALQEVKRLFNANKAGHTGALDPLATGLLPLCFGEATKVSALMLDDDKRYLVTLQLGVMTDTGDSEGKVIAEMPVPAFDNVRLRDCLADLSARSNKCRRCIPRLSTKARNCTSWLGKARPWKGRPGVSEYTSCS